MKKNLVTICFLFCAGIGTSIAQYTDIHNFKDTGSAGNANGASPDGGLTLSGSVLYGMTNAGGANNDGSVFSINTNGTGYKDLLDFNFTNGENPYGSLILSGNILYGMTSLGGSGNGNIFSIHTDGTGYTNLLDFGGSFSPLGGDPDGALTLSGSTLYGVAGLGGANGDGCVFSISTTGSGYTDMYDFSGAAGAVPTGGLVLAGNVLYGMAQSGGAQDSGCVFSIHTDGSGYTDLLDFTGPNGREPIDALIISGKVLYGVTSYGGAFHIGCVFSVDTNGSNYKDILDFDNGNGSLPNGPLLLSGNTLYGTTYVGTMFAVNTDGSGYTNLYTFTNPTGEFPNGSLIVSGNTFYGMTNYGGANNAGVIFSFKDVGLEVNNLTENSGAINVYPNPSNGIFKLGIKNYESGVNNVEIYNILGERVFDETMKQVQGDNNIDLSAQPSGIYLYRVIAESGELIGEGKLVIQK